MPQVTISKRHWHNRALRARWYGPMNAFLGCMHDKNVPLKQLPATFDAFCGTIQDCIDLIDAPYKVAELGPDGCDDIKILWADREPDLGVACCTVTVLLRELAHEIQRHVFEDAYNPRSAGPPLTEEQKVRWVLVYRLARNHVPVISAEASNFIALRHDDLSKVIKGFRRLALKRDDPKSIVITYT